MVQWLSICCARPRVGGPLLVGDEGPSCAPARWPVGCVSPLRPNTTKSTSGFLRKKVWKKPKAKTLQISFILSSHIIITTKLLNIRKKIKSECQKNTENDYGLVVELRGENCLYNLFQTLQDHRHRCPWGHYYNKCVQLLFFMWFVF